MTPIRWHARHPEWTGEIVGWTDTGDPFDRIQLLLQKGGTAVGWPRRRWRVAVDYLECQFCGAWNKPHASPMVEIRESPTGQVVECNCCGRGTLLPPDPNQSNSGRAGRTAPADGLPGSVSGKTPRSRVPSVEPGSS